MYICELIILQESILSLYNTEFLYHVHVSNYQRFLVSCPCNISGNDGHFMGQWSVVIPRFLVMSIKISFS